VKWLKKCLNKKALQQLSHLLIIFYFSWFIIDPKMSQQKLSSKVSSLRSVCNVKWLERWLLISRLQLTFEKFSKESCSVGSKDCCWRFSTCRVKFNYSQRWLSRNSQKKAIKLTQRLFMKGFYQPDQILSHIPIHGLVVWVSFATFRWKETNEIEIGDWD